MARHMTFPDPTFDHRHVSEREPDGTFEDCLWASAVEVLRWGGLAIPATLQEAEELRAASGEPTTGPSNVGNLRVGAQKKYGIDLKAETTWRTYTKGVGVIALGRLSHFPPGHTLRKWSPNYDGGHAVAVFRLDDQPRWWWCDPLAPAVWEGKAWTGQWVSEEQLSTFRKGFEYVPVRRGVFSLPDTSTEEPTLLITRTAFLGGPRVIRFLPGAKAAGYVARDSQLVETVPERTWTAESLAKAAYDVLIDGKRYFQMIEGYYGAPGKSSFVPASDLIIAEPDPKLEELAYNAGLEDATRAVQMLPRKAA